MMRQHHLRHQWGFECACAHCTAGARRTAESDARIERIRALRAQLRDGSAGSAATPRAAEQLVALYGDEGLADTRAAEAYYGAAVEWSGAGDAGRARRFAALCLGSRRGAAEGDAVRPFMDDMRALAREPEGHWSWRFRVREGGGRGRLGWLIGR